MGNTVAYSGYLGCITEFNSSRRTHRVSFLQRLRTRVVPLDAAIVCDTVVMLDTLQQGRPVSFVTFRFSIAFDVNDDVFCLLRLVT
jgi:hypothetical protein